MKGVQGAWDAGEGCGIEKGGREAPYSEVRYLGGPSGRLMRWRLRNHGRLSASCWIVSIESMSCGKTSIPVFSYTSSL